MVRRNQQPATWQDVRNLRLMLWCANLIGPIFIFTGLHANYRDRPSLQWPTASGTMMESLVWHHQASKSSYYYVSVAYRYDVNDKHHIGHQVALCNPDLHGSHDQAKSFVAAHRTNTPVEVYYDPDQPERAVIIPGADEAGNRVSIGCGAVIFAACLFGTIYSRKPLAKILTDKKAAAAKAASPEKISALPHAFATYEPANKRKLNCFTDREELLEVLGHGGKKLQDWMPQDRVIDTAGREYRLIQSSNRKSYSIEPTGETWSCEKLLELAEADLRLIKKNPHAIRRAVDAAPPDRKMAVLMKGIDDLPMGPRWAIIGLVLFLILFFLTVLFVTVKIVLWFQK